MHLTLILLESHSNFLVQNGTLKVLDRAYINLHSTICHSDEGGGEEASESDGPVAVVHVDEGVVGAGLAPELAHPTGHQRREGRFAPGALGGARELLPLVIVTLPPRRRITWRWLDGAACRGRG